MNAGDVIGAAYTLESKLGVGSFGETWIAHNAARGRVVVKVGRQQQIESYGREWAALRAVATNLSKAQSRGVRAMLDVGTDSEGRPYIVYPWVEGDTLESVLKKEGRLSTPRALTVARAMADGLAVLHASGVVHRDIKPSNILLPTDPKRDGEAVLLDLGLSGVLREETGTTMAGQTFGTPYYMSPEQVSARPQSPAADVYGLGTVLYEMLYGHRPFEAENIGQLVLKLMTQPPAFDRSQPELVRAFVASALEKDPAKRPADGAAARDWIDQLLQTPSAPTPQGVSVVERSIMACVAGPLPAVASEATGSFHLPATPTVRLAPPAFLTATMLGTAGILLATRAHGAVWASVLGGGLLGMAGLLASYGITIVIRARKTPLAMDSEALHGRTMTREELSESMAMDLGELIARCEGAGDRMLGMSIGLMIREYRDAKSFDDRQKAMMSATQLLEKLNVRLSPWYVRNDKLVPTLVAIVSVVSAVITMTMGLVGKK